jgi:transcriptional regulator with XRE-family HTH domain
MPRKPSHRSIVRDIREKMGLTQSNFADRLGTTFITISRIENGSLKISRKLALRISWSTGVVYRDIIKNVSGPLQTWDGSELTRSRSWELEQKACKLSDKDLELTLASITKRVDLLLRKAIGSAPKKFYSLNAAIVDALASLEKEFGLDKAKVIRPKMTEEQSAKRPNLHAL